MEEIASLWSYQEIVDEMRHTHLSTALGFEQFRAETIEELRKRNEFACQLIQLLKELRKRNEFACQLIQLLKDVSQERDEAIDQLKKLSGPPLIQNESPVLFQPTKAGNSSITESNSLSEAAVSYNSHGSSPVDSFFDAVSLPNLSNINMADSNKNVGYLSHQPVLMREMPSIDHASLIMDNLIKGKPLPQKGKFLEAVLDTPPLLHSLLLAGPLPKWRNPPRPQMFHIPPFSMQKDAEVVEQKQVSNVDYGGLSRSHNYIQMPCGSSQMPTTPMYNFASSGSCLGASNLGSGGASLNNVFLPKRQRLQ